MASWRSTNASKTISILHERRKLDFLWVQRLVHNVCDEKREGQGPCCHRDFVEGHSRQAQRKGELESGEKLGGDGFGKHQCRAKDGCADDKPPSANGLERRLRETYGRLRSGLRSWRRAFPLRLRAGDPAAC